MTWIKCGQVFKINSQKDEFLISHASNPLPIYLDGNIYRVFYSGRDKYNRSSVGYVDIDLLSNKIVKENYGIILKYGDSDSFYSHGISIGNMYLSNNEKYILFMGWSIRNNEHWIGKIGRLRLIDSIKLEITSETPFIAIDKTDRISLSYPCVLFHEGIYKMWYGSTLSWTSENGEMIHVINYATSIDGENWEKQGLAIPYELGVAQAFSRPTVIINDLGFHMWYSYRSGLGDKYRIGYSFSLDGLNWIRKHNETGIDVSEIGWDNEMICYPYVIEHKGHMYMFYNGNDYGKEGFGLAKWKK